MPFCKLVMVEEGDVLVQTTIEAQMGLFVHGTVLGPNGEPVRNAQVFGWPPSTNVNAKDDGTFVIGPFPEGARLELSASTFFGDFSEATAVVMAGDTNVVLRLELVASVSGVLRDREGRGVKGKMSLREATDADRFLSWWESQDSNADGTFEFDGLSPGQYELVVQGHRGGFARLPPFSLASGENRSDLEVELGPSAELLIQCPEGTNVQVLQDGVLIDWYSPQSGESMVVPPGLCDLELHAKGEVLEKRAVRVAEGETVEVVFGQEGD